MEQGGERSPHEFPGIKSSEIGADDFHKIERGKNSMPTNGCNVTALTYLFKMRGTKSSELNRGAQEIWEFHISKFIMTSAEYLPSSVNVEVNWESATSKTRPNGS